MPLIMPKNGFSNGTHVSTTALSQTDSYCMSHTDPTLASRLILICFLATTYKALTEGGSFKATERRGYARAAEIMNSKSLNDFRWCLKITGWIYVGIASTLQRTDGFIGDQDENSFTFVVVTMGTILKGKTAIQVGIDTRILNDKREDEIQCRFQPKLKKFSFLFVR